MNHVIRTVLAAVAVAFAAAFPAHAHAPRENYVWINVEPDHLSGRFELNVNDLRDKLGIDLEGSGEARLADVEAKAERVQAYLRESFSIGDARGELEYEFLAPSLFEDGENFIQYPFRTTRLPSGDALEVHNEIWITPEYLAEDRLHRSLLVVEYNAVRDEEFGSGNVALVFGPDRTDQTVDLSNPGSVLTWPDFLWQGVLHIALGWDHVLFVLVLLLTVVVRRENGSWVPVESFRGALWRTAKVVTVFTVAHSITLSLAALGLVSVHTAAVETVIAFSIIAVALNNIVPRFAAHSWILIFAFGLFHGLGFATVMQELQFRNGLIERILAMFNIGVELGQLAIVLAVLPLLFLMRRQRFYLPVVVNSVSAVAILVAAYWMAERTGLVSA